MGAPTLRLLLVLQLLFAMEDEASDESTPDGETYRVVGDDTAGVKRWLAQNGRSNEWLAQTKQAVFVSRVTPRTLGGSHPDKCKPCVFHHNPPAVCTNGDGCRFCHEQHGPGKKFRAGKKSILVYPEDTWDPTWKPSTPIFIPSGEWHHAHSRQKEAKKKLNHQLSEVHAAREDFRMVQRKLGGKHPHYCEPCYSFQNKRNLGCLKGRDCEFCHEGHTPYHMNVNCNDGMRRRIVFYREDLLEACTDDQASGGGRIVEVLKLGQLKLEN